MTVKELQSQINERLQDVPEEVLRHVLSLLKNFENSSDEDAGHILRILSEDGEVLKKLAQ